MKERVGDSVLQHVMDLIGRNNLQLSYLISVAFCELNDRIDETPGEMESKYGTSLNSVVLAMNERFSEKIKNER